MTSVTWKDKVPILVHSKSHENVLYGARGGLVGLHEANFGHRIGAASLSADWTDSVVDDDVVAVVPGVGHEVAGGHNGGGRAPGHWGQGEEHHEQEGGEQQQHQPAVPETFRNSCKQMWLHETTEALILGSVEYMILMIMIMINSTIKYYLC